MQQDQILFDFSDEEPTIPSAKTSLEEENARLRTENDDLRALLTAMVMRRAEGLR